MTTFNQDKLLFFQTVQFCLLAIWAIIMLFQITRNLSEIEEDD